MSDIAKTLRQWSHHGQASFMAADLKAGAVEIERLRKALTTISEESTDEGAREHALCALEQ